MSAGAGEAAARQLAEIAGVSVELARDALRRSGGDLERSVAELTDSPAPPKPQARPASQPNRPATSIARGSAPEVPIDADDYVRPPDPVRRVRLALPVMAQAPEAPAAPRPLGGALSQMFREPVELVTHGSLDEVCLRAAKDDRWLLVNIQDYDKWLSLELNRSVWSDKAFAKFVRERFHFWQRSSTQLEGRRFRQYYRVLELPHVCVLDPITKRNVVTLQINGDASFMRRQLAEFLRENPKPTIEPLPPKAAAVATQRPPTKPPPQQQQQQQQQASARPLTEEEELQAAIRASLEENNIWDSEALEDGGDNDEAEGFSSVGQKRSAPDRDPLLPVKRSRSAESSSSTRAAKGEVEEGEEEAEAEALSEKEQWEDGEPVVLSEDDEERGGSADVAASPVAAAVDQENLGEEPPEASAEATKVQLRLPSSKLVRRRFLLSAPVRHVLLFAARESGIRASSLSLWSMFPRRRVENLSASLREAGLVNCALTVELDA